MTKEYEFCCYASKLRGCYIFSGFLSAKEFVSSILDKDKPAGLRDDVGVLIGAFGKDKVLDLIDGEV